MQGGQISANEFAAWNRRVAHAVLQFDTCRFLDILLDAIRTVSPFEYAVVVIYRPGVPPVIYHHTFEGDVARQAVKRFETATYVLNPVYNAFLAGLKPGIYRITELAPDDYFSIENDRIRDKLARDDEELGYRTPGWPAKLAELIVAVPLPGGGIAEISLSRPVNEGFCESCIDRLKLVEPVVSALFNMHWEKVGASVSGSSKSLLLDNLLRDFGSDTLTEREREVAQLILRVHSGGSISLKLGIAASTVKSHRQNLYAKLKLATQQELFSHFLQSMPLAHRPQVRDFVGNFEAFSHPLGGEKARTT